MTLPPHPHRARSAPSAPDPAMQAPRGTALVQVGSPRPPSLAPDTSPAWEDTGDPFLSSNYHPFECYLLPAGRRPELGRIRVSLLPYMILFSFLTYCWILFGPHVAYMATRC